MSTICTHPEAPFNETDHQCPYPVGCQDCACGREQYMQHTIKPRWLMEQEEGQAMDDTYATYTYIDYRNTGMIHIVGLADDGYVLVDWAADHAKALAIMADRAGDYFQVRLCYPGRSIHLSEEDFWQANEDAEKAALAYLTDKWERDMREWAEECGKLMLRGIEEQSGMEVAA